LLSGTTPTIQSKDSPTSPGAGTSLEIHAGAGAGAPGAGGDLYLDGGSASTADQYGDILLGTNYGKVGIGETSPDELLHMYSTTYARLKMETVNDSAASQVQFYRALEGPAVVTDGKSLGVMNGYGYDGDEYHKAAQITFSVDGTASNNDMPGKIVFHTVDDGTTTLDERMRIDNAGNVGIGITSPIAGLDIDTEGFDGIENYMNIRTHSTHNTTSDVTQYYYGTFINKYNNVSSGITNSGKVTGIYARGALSGPGTLNEVYGGRFIGGSAPGGTGTITKAYGLYAGVLNGAGATITDAYGVYIGSISATNEWGVYQIDAVANNYFNGAVGIKQAGSLGSYELYVNGDACDSNGALSTCSSDRRLKENIKTLENATELLLKLSPKTFNWQEDGKADTGLIAQEVQEVYPEWVVEKEDGFISYDDPGFKYILIRAVQEQQDIIEDQEQKTQTLNEKISTLEEQNSALVEFICRDNPDEAFCASFDGVDSVCTEECASELEGGWKA